MKKIELVQCWLRKTSFYPTGLPRDRDSEIVALFSGKKQNDERVIEALLPTWRRIPGMDYWYRATTLGRDGIVENLSATLTSSATSGQETVAGNGFGKPLEVPFIQSYLVCLILWATAHGGGAGFVPLNVLDELQSAALRIEIDTSLPACSRCPGIEWTYRDPWQAKALRVDNGPGIISKLLADWAANRHRFTDSFNPENPRECLHRKI